MLHLFWLLIVGHALCDFPLQGDFLARAKDHTRPMVGVSWLMCLMLHSVIQAGMVGLVMGNLIYGSCEFVMHAVIDYGKNANYIGFGMDQALHIICKMMWVAAWYVLQVNGIELPKL